MEDGTAIMEEAAEVSQPRRKRRLIKRAGWLAVIVLTPLALAALFVSTPIGKRFIADQIGQYSTASGLRVEIGRIEGDVFSRSVLRDVRVSDPQGTFLTVPEVEYEWRPFAWFWNGLDIRELSIRRGQVERLPELLPGDPDARFLPDFDIRLDRFEVENLTFAAGVAGERAERADLLATIDIRQGRVLIDADGAFGPEDRIDLLLDAEPDGDRFDLSLDYLAAPDGPSATLTGLTAGYEARIVGAGTWEHWLGHALISRAPGADEALQSGDEDAHVAALRLTNDDGRFGLVGQIFPTLSDGSTLDRALGDAVSLSISGGFEDNVFDGKVDVLTTAIELSAAGALDLGFNRLDRVNLAATLTEPEIFGANVRLSGTRLEARIAGPLTDPDLEHRLSVDQLDINGQVAAIDLLQQGVASFNDGALKVPLDVTTARVETGVDLIDRQLVGGRLRGAFSINPQRLAIDSARITFPGLSAQPTLRGNLASGSYVLAGPITANDLVIEELGKLNVGANLAIEFGSSAPWNLAANVDGSVSEIANSTVSTIAGDRGQFTGAIAMGTDRPLTFADATLETPFIDAQIEGGFEGSDFAVGGRGQHADYGPFAFDTRFGETGSAGSLMLSDPYPAAKISDVSLNFGPVSGGYAVQVSGGSILGPFAGDVGLALPDSGPTQIDIKRLTVSRTEVLGKLALGDEGLSGDLTLGGGGIEGILGFDPGPNGARGFTLDLSARQARFDGATPLALAFADLSATGILAGRESEISGRIDGSGLSYGDLSIANYAVEGAFVDEAGSITASIAGRRSDRFALKLEAGITPGEISLFAQGEYAGDRISMPRRAILTALPEGGYALPQTQIDFADGGALIEGRIGGIETHINAQFARMPLRIADLVGAELGLGGRMSGLAEWRQRGSDAPTGSARLRIDDFTRSGLILSSRPVDVYAVANLRAEQLQTAARLRDDDVELGSLEASITALEPGGGLIERLNRGRLNATLRYEGAAESLWRLAAIETFDLTGEVELAAQAQGTLANPRINGSVVSNNLRLQSAISGTDIERVRAQGRFAGSRLELTSFAGSTQGGGTVTGSGTVNFAQMSARSGPAIDIRAALDQARLLNANGLVATLTGPLRIISNGSGGAIAGRLSVDRASWKLGVAAEDMALPEIPTREINRRDQVAATERAALTSSWRYLIDARTSGGVAVDGMGLASEWGVDIALRGTVSDPRIGGEARLVRGAYTFANTRFDLTRGRILFDQQTAIDPRLDIEAQASANGTDVTIDITGNAQAPEIAFASTPALPEEEILARLLFGGSVTSLSATDAVQLGAALAALQGGGGGLDPIGELRRSIGLDQLRIISADPALGRGTGVALGKNLTRRFYIELITDGQGYSATQVEYRITGWLSLLGSVSTIGRDSVLAEISRDY